MAYTQQTFSLPGQRYGSFAGKETSDEPAGPHTPSVLTQLAPYAISGGRYVFVAKGESAEPPPPPTGQVGTGSGGGRAFGHYPPILDKRALKRTIARAAKEKKRIERQLQFATGPTALERLLQRLNEKQELLAVRMEEYRELLNRERSEAEEEMEFIEMITELL